MLNRRLPGDTYVTCPDELEVLEHAREGVERLRALGYALVVVTNQRGVARGFMDAAALEAVHAKLERELGPFAGIYACVHDRDAGCGCRKPAPGLFLRAIEDLGLEAAGSLVVGDSERDVIAAEAAGVGRRLRVASDADWRGLLEDVPAAHSG